MFGGIVLSTTLLALGSPVETTPIQVRVLTFNVWGLPIISPSREERIERTGRAVAELRPDLVTFQEVWLDEDAGRLAAAMKDAGLVHIQRFQSSWPGHSGLLIASSFPIRDVAFKAYTLGRELFRPWHLDFIAGKGMARVRVDTPIGPVDFAGTHAQAGYESTTYVPIQVAQMIEASDLLGRAFGVDRPPLILAGDLNAAWNEIPIRILEARGGLRPAAPGFGDDAVMFRSGGRIEVRPLEVKRVLEEPVRLSDGSMLRLSDHPAILADMELQLCEGCAVATAEERSVVREALAVLNSDFQTWSETTDVARGATFALFALAVAAIAIGRKQPRIRRRALYATAALFIAVCGWCVHVGFISGPAQLGGLALARTELERDVQLP